MPIDIIPIGVTLIFGLVLGAVVAWLASRPAVARLQSTLDKDRAVHAERLKAYGEAEAKLRDAFQAMSAEALKSNNQQFLDLAETRLRSAHRGRVGHRCTQAGDRASAGADGEDARAGRSRDQGRRAPPRRDRRRTVAADRRARHGRPVAPRRNPAAHRCAETSRRPRPVGRAPAEAG